MDDEEARKKIHDGVNELAAANYEGKVKSLAVVWVDDNNDMRILMTIGANMQLAMAGAVTLLDFELKTMLQKECSNEQ